MRPLAAAILWTLACVGADRPPAADPGPVPAELAEGAALFAAGCRPCHGVYAQGTDSGPPLVHRYYVPAHHGDEAFQRAVALGVVPHHWNFGPMPPVAGLDRGEVDRIVAYVRWLQRRAGLLD